MQTERPIMVWRKASRSNNNGSCVEVGGNGRHIAVRDTKHREAGHLTITPDDWRGFLATFAK